MALLAIYKLAALSTDYWPFARDIWLHKNPQLADLQPTTSIYNDHLKGHKTWFEGIKNRDKLFISLISYKLTPLTLQHKYLGHTSIMPASSITTYDQDYKVSEAFPEDQWISILATLTLVVAGVSITLQSADKCPGQATPHASRCMCHSQWSGHNNPLCANKCLQE